MNLKKHFRLQLFFFFHAPIAINSKPRNRSYNNINWMWVLLVPQRLSFCSGLLTGFQDYTLKTLKVYERKQPKMLPPGFFSH